MSILNNVRETTINDKKVQIFLLPAGKGIKMATQLSKIILPVVTSLSDNSDNEMGMSYAAGILVESMDDLDVMGIITQLINSMAIDNQEIQFDTYFMANYGELLEIVTFALEQNFSSFFSGKGFAKMLEKMPKA